MSAGAALAVVEGAKLISDFAQAKKGSSATKQAAEQMRRAEMAGQEQLKQAWERQQQAFAPFAPGGQVMQQLGQYAWNPQTRAPMGPGGGGMTMAGLFPGMGQPPQRPTPPMYTGAGMGTTAQPNTMQLSDLMDAGMSPGGSNMQSMFMRDPKTLMVREVPWDQVSMLRMQGWTPVQAGGR